MSSTPAPTMPSRGLATLSPANFGMVMATGIVSLAAKFLQYDGIALALFYLNMALYGVLICLTIVRAWCFPRHFIGDMMDHAKGMGFFTFVAGTNVLASQTIIIGENYRIATVLGGIGLVSWALLTYVIFTVFVVKESKPSLDAGINGAWLLAVVATQSIAVLSALVAARTGQLHRLEMNFVALSMWLWGGMLYIWMMSLIFYRYTFFRLAPGDLAPPYWINMGAMAISTLVGAQLIENAPHAPYLYSLLPFVKGFTVFYWATATWWIPMLVILGFWRHVYKRFPLNYDPLYWGAVFPLGMYAACTWRLAKAMDLPFLEFIPSVFFPIAMIAWSVTFVGLLRRVGRRSAALV